jgi:transposase
MWAAIWVYSRDGGTRAERAADAHQQEGDPYLRTLLVQGAHHILGPFGADSDLRRWGLKLAERGGKSGKKRAIIAVARKLAVLLHRLWVSGEVYEPLRNHPRAMPAAA